jgi:ABC-type bacteriocin/lantibiotic exporter with double-glycine peptidase domain
MGIFLTGSRRRERASKRLFFFFLLIVLATVLPACSAKRFSDLRPGLEQRGHYIEHVPFYKQTESTCGPAALASVLAFWGRPVDLDTITRKIFLPRLRGTLPMDLEQYAREEGFRTASFSGSLDELKISLRKGVPVICLVDLGFSIYRRPHYITVIGFDDVNSVIIGHDGVQPNSVLDYDAFRSAWDRADRWMIVITPEHF